MGSDGSCARVPDGYGPSATDQLRTPVMQLCSGNAFGEWWPSDGWGLLPN